MQVMHSLDEEKMEISFKEVSTIASPHLRKE